MTRDTSIHRSLAALVRASALIIASGSVASAAPAATDAPDTVVATVCSVDANALTLELMTGVGHALRVVPVRLAPECKIQDAGTTARLDDVRPGRIVRVRCRVEPERAADAPRVAVSIECLPPEGLGEAR